MKILLIFFVVFSILKKEVESISCYNCNSYIDVRCASKKIPDYMKVNCSDSEENKDFIMCRTIHQEVEYHLDNMPKDRRVIRECGWSDTKYIGKCYDQEGLGGRIKVCSCTEDFCNSAPKLLSSQILATLVLSSLVAYICQ